MSRPQPVLARLLAIGVMLAFLAGCSTASPPAGTSSPQASSSSPPASTSSPQPTVSPACASADAFAAALTSFKDTLKKPSSTLEQVHAARDQVATTYNALIKDVGNAAKERVDAVTTAEDKFAAAVANVPNDATLAEALGSLRDEAANVQGALSDLAAEVKC